MLCEHYGFTWHGKSEALKLSELPSKCYLDECKEESLDWDTTKNIFIEGDNLEALKLLQDSYLEKVKMIYIDPPYNTGKNFLYKDNFIISKRDYRKISSSDDFSARKHTDWLNMIYPRLKLARRLLKDDGVIFVSIDDNEVAQLRLLMDEIFGEENFVRELIWLKNNAQNDAESIEKNHEYILVYQKSKTKINRINQEIKEIYKDNFNNYFYVGAGITTGGAGGTLNARPNLGYTIYYNQKTDEKIAVQDYDKEKAKVSNNESEVYKNREDLLSKGFKIIRPPKKGVGLGCWTWALEKFNSEKDKILIKKNRDGYSVFKKEFVKKEEIYSENNKFYYQINKEKPLKSFIKDISSSLGTKNLNELFGIKLFENSKPVNLIKYLIEVATKKDDIILDFFAGSGTTGDAVMQLNAEDKGNRKYILVQLPEPCNEKSEAYKAGYKNICEIGKERIRRAGNKIKEEHPNYNGDLGFKVFKTLNPTEY